MKTSFLSLISMACCAVLFACNSMPRTNPNLEDARVEYSAARNNPDVTTLAPLELKEAGDALDAANGAWVNHIGDSEVDRLSYIAKRKVETAQELTKQRLAEQAVIATNQKRDQILLAQRSAEANNAMAQAAIAKDQARAAENKADDAQRQTQDAQAYARQLEAQLHDLSAQKTARGIVVTFGDVLFNTGQAQLTAAGMESVQKLAAILHQNPNQVVLIEGFTDSTGSATFNLDLSERRAASVGMALTQFGVPREKLTTRGYGVSYPVSDNATAAGRQLNRRVEITLAGESGIIPPRQ